MGDLDSEKHTIKLTYSQRKNLLTYLDTHPLFRFVQTLEERMSGDYVLDRDQLLAGVYALRLAVQSDQFSSGRRRRPLLTMLEQFEEALGLELSQMPSSEEEKDDGAT